MRMKATKAGRFAIPSRGLPAPSYRKYRNKKTEFNGVLFDSALEARKAEELDLLVKAGEIKGYDRQFIFPIIINGKKVCSYRADFVVHHKDKSREIIECKGFWTDTARLKWKLVEATYGGWYKMTIAGTPFKAVRKCKK
jgi:hypothetical protein